MIRIITALLAAIALAFLLACDLDLAKGTPVGASVRRSYSGRTREIQIPAWRLRPFMAWFSQHRSGWSKSPASYIPGLVISIQYKDGSEAFINISHNGSVVVNDRSGQYVKQFTPAEISDLESVIL